MSGFSQTHAILWAQGRSIWNWYPRSSRGGIVFTAAGTALWYGMAAAAAVGAAFVFSNPANRALFPRFLGGGLFLALLYCQLVPLLLASSGISLDLRKLLVYPIPSARLFGLEVLLRVSVCGEVLTVLAGTALGLALNPMVPPAGLLALALFAAFNLLLSAGLRDLLRRILARRGVREAFMFLLVLAAALPQLLLMRRDPSSLGRATQFVSLSLSPWTAAADIALGGRSSAQWLALLGWTLAAWAFGRWQFIRSLAFDEREAGATPSAAPRYTQPFERLLAWPSAVFKDPLGALVEKELRFLARAPRFRLVFLMGFSFGLLVWLPLAFGRYHGPSSGFAANYLTFVSVYALLLLGEVTFYNMFGFDRAAAQAYYVLPVRLHTVVVAKNLAAVFFVLAEVTLVALVCALLRMPVSLPRVVEAYAVTAIMSVYMLAVGNLSSTHFPRPVDPAQSWRSGGAGRFQAMLLLVYPVLSIPILLAYLARYAFESNLAFYAVLAVAGAIGTVFYWVATDSALAAAERNKERILAALGSGQGPVAA
ncbi:MAG: hypothetical protein HY822_02650 [Acidobacteria bacterium]|nr:hypothetical protein [Acidobacteriota bacterium]